MQREILRLKMSWERRPSGGYICNFCLLYIRETRQFLSKNIYISSQMNSIVAFDALFESIKFLSRFHTT